MFKTFLKPKWVLLAVFVVLFSYFAFTLLAPWQLGKDHDIVERNKAIEAAYSAEPVPLDQAVSTTGPTAGTAKEEWTRVALRGHYLPDSEVLLRLRPVNSGPTYQSLVPFADTSGLVMLVNRGWVSAGDGNVVPDIAPAPAGEVTVEAMLRHHEGPHPKSQPIMEDGYHQIYTINPAQAGQLTGLDLGVDYLQISEENQPGALGVIPVPQLDRGSHLSYGFQWIAFGIMAPLGLGYFAWAEIKERQRYREEQRLLDAAEAQAMSADEASHTTTVGVEPAHTDPGAGGESSETPAPAAAGKATETAESGPGTTGNAPEEQPPAPRSRRRHARYGDAKPDFYGKLNRRGRERF